jgi:hypothetical protein
MRDVNGFSSFSSTSEPILFSGLRLRFLFFLVFFEGFFLDFFTVVVSGTTVVVVVGEVVMVGAMVVVVALIVAATTGTFCVARISKRGGVRLVVTTAGALVTTEAEGCLKMAEDDGLAGLAVVGRTVVRGVPGMDSVMGAGLEVVKCTAVLVPFLFRMVIGIGDEGRLMTDVVVAARGVVVASFFTATGFLSVSMVVFLLASVVETTEGRIVDRISMIGFLIATVARDGLRVVISTIFSSVADAAVAKAGLRGGNLETGKMKVL